MQGGSMDRQTGRAILMDAGPAQSAAARDTQSTVIWHAVPPAIEQSKQLDFASCRPKSSSRMQPPQRDAP